MQEIPRLFVPDPETGLATDQVTTGCEWVAQGQGVATQKFDGLCALFHQGKLWKRRVLKVREAQEAPALNFEIAFLEGVGVVEWEGTSHTRPLCIESCPDGFRAVQRPIFEGDDGRLPGWVPVDFEDPVNVHFKDAWDRHGSNLVDGRTYELCGPKVNGNPYDLNEHLFQPHGAHQLVNAPRLFSEMKDWLADYSYEGIVFRVEDGRMARVKRKDFGLDWPV